MPPIPQKGRKVTKWKITDHRKVIALYQMGYSTPRIQKMTGIPQGTICGILKRNGIPRRDRRSYPGKRLWLGVETIALLRFLYERKMLSYKEIGEMFGGVHPTTVGHWMKLAGIKPRSRSDSLKLMYKRGRREPYRGGPKKRALVDSNHRPPVPQTGALSPELRTHGGGASKHPQVIKIKPPEQLQAEAHLQLRRGTYVHTSRE